MPGIPRTQGHAGNPDAPRFTPAEMMELVQDKENPLTQEEIAAMHPSDQLMLDFVRKAAVDSPVGPLAVGMPMSGMLKSIGGLEEAVTGGKLARVAKAAWNHAAPVVGTGVGATLGAMTGHPYIGAAMGGRMFGKMMFPMTAEAPAAVSAEEKLIADLMASKQYSTREQAAQVAKSILGRSAVPAAGTPKSNVIKEGPLTGNAADVQGGVQNDFRGPVGFDKSGGVADKAGLDRALQEEMRWVAKQKGAMPTGAGNAPQTAQDYNAWSAGQDAKFPNKPVPSLLEDLKASLAKDAVKRRTPK